MIESILIWVGLGCVFIVGVGLSSWLSCRLVILSLEWWRPLKRMVTKMMEFREVVGGRHLHRYTICIYDKLEDKVVKLTHVNENGQTDVEYEREINEWKRQFIKE